MSNIPVSPVSPWPIGEYRDGFPTHYVDDAGGYLARCPLCADARVQVGEAGPRDDLPTDDGVDRTQVIVEGISCNHRWAYIFTSFHGMVFCNTRRLPDFHRKPASPELTQLDRPVVYHEEGSVYSFVATAAGRDDADQFVMHVGVIRISETVQDASVPICSCGSRCWVAGPGVGPTDHARWSCAKCGGGRDGSGAAEPAQFAPIQRVARKSIPAAIRWFIIQQADFTCTYCKRRHYSSQVGPDDRPWHIDHAVPLARGGVDAPENLCLSCEACNLKKSVRMPHEFQP